MAKARSIKRAAKEILKDDLSKCTEFQDLVGAPGDPATAANSIYLDVLPLPANKTEFTVAEINALRPYAIIFGSDSEPINYTRIATGTFSCMVNLAIRIEQNLPNDLSDVDPEQAILDFDDTLDRIRYYESTEPAGFVSLADLSHQSGSLATNLIGEPQDPEFADYSDQPGMGSFVRGWITVAAGVAES